jgi:predicted PurR-regulated permease PerM
MEFFLPSLLVILVGTLIAFFIIPKFSPLILAILSVALLAFGVYHHYRLFQHEYAYSTWLDQLKPYAGMVMIGLIVLISIFYFIGLFSTGKASPPAINNSIMENLPSPNTATNILTEGINNTIRAVNNMVNGRNNGKKNNGGLLENMTNSAVETFSNVKSLLEPAPAVNVAKQGNLPRNNRI